MKTTVRGGFVVLTGFDSTGEPYERILTPQEAVAFARQMLEVIKAAKPGDRIVFKIDDLEVELD